MRKILLRGNIYFKHEFEKGGKALVFYKQISVCEKL